MRLQKTGGSINGFRATFNRFYRYRRNNLRWRVIDCNCGYKANFCASEVAFAGLQESNRPFVVSELARSLIAVS